MATTHTEIYRTFQGHARPRALRFLPLTRACIATATKRKLPLLILYTPVYIAAIVLSFVVYTLFSLQEGVTPAAFGGGRGGPNPGMMLAAGFAKQIIQVHQIIVISHLSMSFFAILILAWYGAGQISEDRRLGAHLLYFARPLTRADYLLGKFLAVAFFGVFAVLVPSLIICAVAAITSPDWSFVKHEGMVIVNTVLYSLLFLVTWTSTVLAISSVCSRKTFALVATFGFLMLPLAVARSVSHLLGDRRFMMLSLQDNLQRIATGWLDAPSMGSTWPIGFSLAIVAAFIALSWSVLVLRVRRMEAVA